MPDRLTLLSIKDEPADTQGPFNLPARQVCAHVPIQTLPCVTVFTCGCMCVHSRVPVACVPTSEHACAHVCTATSADAYMCSCTSLCS